MLNSRHIRVLFAAICAVCPPVSAVSQEIPPLKLPQGFSAQLFAREIASGTRHIALRGDGTLYARVQDGDGGVYAIKDTDGDGAADKSVRFGKGSGTGIAIYKDYLYYSTDGEVYRQKLKEGALEPDQAVEAVVTGLTDEGQHGAKSIALDPSGNLYVNVGAPSNACQVQDRSKGSPGQNPCALLARAGGIWRFDGNKINQKFRDGERYATGVRNAVALAWNGAAGDLFLVQHGRDQLSSFFPQYYSDDDNAELPAEEFQRIKKGSDVGWPYTYFDPIKGKRMLAPEYGGDGKKISEDAKFQLPLVGFPGHWAPNGLVFYSGSSFPQRFQNGAFIAFHGSWNRAPRPQAGYLVAFVPYKDGNYGPAYEIFADNFSGGSELRSPGEALARPMGLAVALNGDLFISDSKRGRVWRVSYSAEEAKVAPVS